MHSHRRRIYKRGKQKWPQFSLFLIPMFAVLFADSFMAYGFPVVLDSAIANAGSLGLILGFSSLAGIICDFVLPRMFGDRSWKRLLGLGIVIGTFFPLLTLLGVNSQSVILMLLASASWGIYYELVLISGQDFISNEEAMDSQSRDWSIFAIVWHFAILFAPIIASILIDNSVTEFITGAFAIYLLALILYWIILVRRKGPQAELLAVERPPYSFESQKKYLRSLFFYFVIAIGLTLLTSLYWGYAGLFGEYFATTGSPSWLIFTGFSAGLLVGSVIKLRVNIPATQKSLAISLLLSGITLSLTIFSAEPLVITSLIFVSTIFLAMTEILLATVFSVEGELAQKEEMYALNVERLGISFGFIIFPVILGSILDATNFSVTFALAGVVAAALGGVCLVFALWNLKHKKAAAVAAA